ncbi:hypothetical protein LCGC14_2360260, partial [marine sediment metagenome]
SVFLPADTSDTPEATLGALRKWVGGDP